MLRHHRRGDRGAVLVLVAPMLVVLYAITALTIDMGNARQESRHAQASADAAALAGARELPVMAPVSDAPFVPVRDEARKFADKNLDGSTSFVEVTCSADLPSVAKCYTADETRMTIIAPYSGSALSGPHAYNLVYVEICQPTATFFSQVIGASSPTVCRDAVGRRQNVSGGYGMGLIVLDETACDALVFAGDSGTVLSSNGAVMVNSECPNNALSATGQAWELTTEYIGVVGGASLAPCSPPYNCTEAIPQTGIDHFPDPYGDVVPPAPESFPQSPTNVCSNSGTMVLKPGRYTEGCQKSSGDFIVRPGVYYFEKGFKATGGSVVCMDESEGNVLPPPPDLSDPSVSGPPCTGGVTFIIGGTGSLELGGNGWIHLPPPTDGPYAGISIYQVSSAASKVNGTSEFLLGSIYAPNAYYEFTGSSGSNEVNINGMVITETAKVSGKFQFNINVPVDAPEALPEDDFGLWE